MRHALSALLLLTPLSAREARSDRPDLTIISRIKTEAFDNAQVMDTYLTDAYGLRLTAGCGAARAFAAPRLMPVRPALLCTE